MIHWNKMQVSDFDGLDMLGHMLSYSMRQVKNEFLQEFLFDK